ncbi:MAG: BamA/TamA family outer membrane protein [Thermoanaerobaculales bacterium]|nr:BamA/TamA family outer membrane protein [Thermoanaerobaculales bacterium]
MTKRRLLLGFAAVVLGLVLIAAMVSAILHSDPVRRRLARTATDRLEAATGWQIAIGEPSFRLWPARIVLTDVTVGTAGRQVASARRVEARWRWSAIAGEPRVIDFIGIDGLEVDLRDPPPLPAVETGAAPASADPWRVVEIGRLRVDGGGLAAALGDVVAEVAGLEVGARLAGGAAEVELTAEHTSIDRAGRRLELGALELRASASSAGAVVDELSLTGGDLELRARGEVGLGEPVAARAELMITADLSGTVGWWDPNLATGLEPSGRAELASTVNWDRDGGLAIQATHRGEPLTVAGTVVDALDLAFAGGVVRAAASGSTWGEAEMAVDGDGVATVEARLQRAPADRLLAFAVPEVAAAVGTPLLVSGDLSATLSYPLDLENLAGRCDLVAISPIGRVALMGEGAAGEWRVEEARIEAFAATVTGSGRARRDGVVEGAAELAVDDPAETVRLAESRLPELAGLGIGGGPLTGRLEVAGAVRSPRLAAEVEWLSPELLGQSAAVLTASATGGLEAVDLSARLVVDEGTELAVEGVAGLAARAVEGRWRAGVDNLGELAIRLGLVAEELDAYGAVYGEGGFSAAGDAWSFGGEIEGVGVGAGGWVADAVRAEVSAGPDQVEVSALRLEVLDGTVEGSATIGLGGLDAPVVADLRWQGLDPARLPMSPSALAAGTSDGRLVLEGTIARPVGRLDIGWTPRDPASKIPALRAGGVLEAGVLRLSTEEVSTEAGALSATGEAPLGSLPLPEWLWPDAPEGTVRVSAHGSDLRSAAIVELLGIAPPPVDATGDLRLEAEWDPAAPEATRALVELDRLRLRHPGGELAAEGPLVVQIERQRAEVRPVVLVGPRSRVELSGSADLATGAIDGSLGAVLDPRIAQLIPFPIQLQAPIRVAARVAGSLERPRATLSVDHTGGAIVLRDPPLQVLDLVLEAELVDGVLWVDDGSARVNQGTMELAGGWDPASGQGIVAELDGVVFYVDGILSQWSGTVAVEPEPGRLARVVGDLNLVGGLWDQRVDLGSALLGGDELDLAADDPLRSIVLDLDVRGRGLVRVDNNLGRFDASWDVLRVGGSAAEPRINGEIEISPGGRFVLAGQRVTVRRGSLRFTGNPDIDPIVEIVPESDIAVFGAGEGEINTTALATQGLVEGIGGALGFENETLQPAEISVETESNTSQSMMLGQRLSHSLALFFAANTTDVQDRTTTLQLWNIPGLKGLALQAFQRTLDEEAGASIFQRFQWGGSSLYDDRPTIRKLKLEGEWPVGARRLKRATGIRRGQPFDSFLPFVARVRMERELAAAGFQEARVSVEAVEANNAWTLVFSCDPGPPQEVVFLGDPPPKGIRDQVTALYQPPPLESYGFHEMASLLDRHLDAEGYPEATVIVERRGDEVVAEVHRNARTELDGPVLEGVPAEVAAAVERRLGRPSELARIAGDRAVAAAAIESVLADLGYDRARALSVETVATGETRAEIRALVELGPRAEVGELVVTGSDPLGITAADDFELAVGSPLDRTSVDLAASALRAAYDGAGYSDAAVRGSVEELGEGRWVVTLHIEPGIRRTFEGVEIFGLEHTSRRSIEAGVDLEPGEVLRNSDLDTVAARVANFAPIERVDLRTVPQGTTGARVELDVVEKPRWIAEVGGGWSTERGGQARFGLRDDNLFGRGFGLNLRGRWDSTEWLAFVVASLPPLPGDRLSFSSTVSFQRGDAPSNPEILSQDISSWSVDSTYFLGRGNRVASQATEQVTGYYRFTRTRTYGVDDSGFFPIEIDTTVDTGLLGARYVRDRFDNPFDPRSGYGLVVDGGYSSDLLGSDFDYWTTLATGSLATGVFGSSTWVQSVRLGVTEPLGGTDLIPEVRFFAGGQGSVRGFDRNTVGPVTIGIGEGFEPAGGGALFILNEELRVPVWGGLRAAVFADVGQVWESWGEADLELSVGAGVGIRWATPVGPLWADVAWPLANTGISSTKPKFYIGIGRPF